MIYITPNETIRQSDSESILAAIALAVETGCRRVRIPRHNKRTGEERWIIDETIPLPSEIEIWVDDAHLILAEGKYLNMFTTGTPGDPTETRNVTLRGTGRATLDGGVYNGLSEKNSLTDGRPHISKNTTLLFFNTSHLTVENLRIVNQRWWAVTNVFVHHATYRNIYFQADFSRIDENGVHYPDQLPLTYQEIYVKNADGIDLRIGCHDILIENISGFAEDDTVALTALGNWERRDGYFVEGASPDIHDVTVRNVVTATPCSCVRLLNANGNKLYNILVDGITALKPQGELRASGTVRIGDKNYATSYATMGDIHHITVRNVISYARRAVSVSNTLCDSVIENLSVMYGVGLAAHNAPTATLKNCRIERIMTVGENTVAVNDTGLTFLP